MQRHRFDITTDTGGDFVDTGPPIEGLIMQVRFVGTAFDTGCDVLLEMINSGGTIADYDNVGGQSWTRVPRILSYDTGGAAVGDQPPVLALDRLRLSINQSDGVVGAKTGTVYVWTGW